jgi:Spy/CpxP family protein refolding chaperone
MEEIMKRTLILIAAVSALLAGTAFSQPGYGPGPGAGYGPGMMGGYGGGMMGGYGPGTMGGYGGGMMGGYGHGMMGPGGYGALADLTADQRGRIKQAQQDFFKKQWPLMQQMHSAEWDGSAADPADEQAARKSYDAASGLHKQMFENQLELRKRIDAVLTPKQREQLRRGPA